MLVAEDEVVLLMVAVVEPAVEALKVDIDMMDVDGIVGVVLLKVLVLINADILEDMLVAEAQLLDPVDGPETRVGVIHIHDNPGVARLGCSRPQICSI